ncbi:MAG: nucleotidyl transferase AbiEii/AbiGii toxin family protein [Kofleriaceae bacterium]|nr:nucleotidyl transferase AbiEii/AbiGii toxin family protein [Kofleriaceae bacterium]
MTEPGPFAVVALVVARAGLRACLIGGHAVNTWIEPRFTSDIDLTVLADRPALERALEELAVHGYQVVQAVGADAPSGPDFLRLAAASGPPLDIQTAKTDYQRQLIARAVATREGLPVATAEDLVILKLIAHRPKDVVDLRGLVALPDLDWAYVEQWAAAWEVADRLDVLRHAASEP